MEFKAAKTTIQNLSSRLHYMLVISLGLLVANVLLIFLVWWALVHQERIIVPAEVKEPFTISGSSVDASYLRQMALFFCNERLNVAPTNVKPNHEIVLQYTDPKYYHKFVTALTGEAEVIVKQNISAVFYPEELIPDPHKLTVLITGTMARFVGNVALPVAKKRFLLKFIYRGGTLKIQEFIDVPTITESKKEEPRESSKIF
jgi:conjugal transfer pilus assembly protein TraE